MTQLSPLRNQLGSLRRKRQAVRWSAAWIAVMIGVLWILAVLFLLDWQLAMTRAQRVMAIVIGLGVMVWAYRRYSRPLLGTHETDLDMALMVERQQQIDSDLVAALQFESPEARRWGSTQLEGAVIDYVAEFSRGWNLLEGFSARQFVKRGTILAVTLALLLAAVLWQPRYAKIFFARLGMGSQHYPTRTMIEEVQVNSVAVPQGSDKPVRTGYGEPVDFAVQISGVVPTDIHKIDLRSVASGTARPIELLIDPKSTSTGGPVVFRGQLPQLVDSLDYQIYLGDAWTDASRLEVIPLPVVEPKLTATPPAYARAMASVADEGTLGARQLSVLEGSRVDLDVQCLNKRLIAATVTIDKQTYPLVSRDADGQEAGRHWTLPVAKTPLARIDSALKYEIQVTDEDGLHLPHPIDGFIRIKVDRPPTIFAAVDVQYFLPTTGMPEITYTVNDDYGISRVQLYAEVIHAPPGAASSVGSVVGDAAAPADVTPATTDHPAGSGHSDNGHNESGQSGAASAAEITVAPIPILDLKPDQPILRGKLPYNGVYHLALNRFKLVKGDQLRVTLEAIDYRGDLPGKPTRSEPLLLNITDESGIMTALSETDLRAAHQMDLLIQRQTQTGASK
jgi:hypothetical protein